MCVYIYIYGFDRFELHIAIPPSIQVTLNLRQSLTVLDFLEICFFKKKKKLRQVMCK